MLPGTPSRRRRNLSNRCDAIRLALGPLCGAGVLRSHRHGAIKRRGKYDSRWPQRCGGIHFASRTTTSTPPSELEGIWSWTGLATCGRKVMRRNCCTEPAHQEDRRRDHGVCGAMGRCAHTVQCRRFVTVSISFRISIVSFPMLMRSCS